MISESKYTTQLQITPFSCMHSEAYVLFYRKTAERSVKRRQRALELMKLSRNEPSLLQFYVSTQWVNKFNTFAEPGPITNHDFLCEHGSVHPDKASYVHELCTIFSRSVWEYLHAQFGGGPTCTKLFVCRTCSQEKEQIDRKRKHEFDTFSRLNTCFTNQRAPTCVYSISMAWFKGWEAFVTRKSHDVPGLIDNSPIATIHPRTGQTIFKVGSDNATISADMWQFLHGIYGGGPAVSQTNRRTTYSDKYSQQPQVSSISRELKTPEQMDTRPVTPSVQQAEVLTKCLEEPNQESNQKETCEPMDHTDGKVPVIGERRPTFSDHGDDHHSEVDEMANIDGMSTPSDHEHEDDENNIETLSL